MAETHKGKSRKVLISILNWNAAEETLKCVDSICSQDASGICAQITVIDNGSRADDWAALQEGIDGERVSLVRQDKNLGFAGGHNLSIKAAVDGGFEFVWLVNNDATVQSDALQKMIEVMDSDQSCGAVAPLCLAAHDLQHVDFYGARHDWGKLSSVRSSSEQETTLLEKTNPYDMWVAGTAVLFRVRALEQTGFLDERLFAYFEDNDISARLALAGWKSRVAFSARIIHSCHNGDDTNRPPYFFYLMQRNFFIFWRKNTPPNMRRFLDARLLDRSLYEANKLYYEGFNELGDAALLGISDGFRGISGAPRLDRRAPISMVFLRYLFSFQHNRALSKVRTRKKLNA